MVRMIGAVALAVLVLMLAPASALAQQPAQRSIDATPRAKEMAVSGNLGFANPFDDDFDDIEPILTGTYEYWFTSEFSIRGLLGYTSFDAGDAEADLIIMNGNFVYSWPHRTVRPYVTGGIGFYNKDYSGPGTGDLDDGFELGMNGGGGVDIFLTNQWAIKIDGGFHGVTGDEPDALFVATAGAQFRW